ncbi:metallophosphoesterase family protein [Lichenicoccus roseus]|uniref:Metallophosphoesterase n=1 Tax=Lichenicoccus roseus TaxID=2683649 RepID=A0A5R9J7Y4_9PROT|nr:metallophosphoesterase [Lichenicoccus roseus]TLU71731.1 metallophosphoesterase [Lichenicoccus roseus]
MSGGHEVLTWLHIGDLHITAAEEQNYKDLGSIVDLANSLPQGSVDFALLPGDNADDGTPDQFRLVATEAARLRMPLHVITGDHDFKPRTLDAFYAVPGHEALPKAVWMAGRRCLFLDLVSAGSGGLDFRLGDRQLDWAEREVEQAEAAGQDVVVFMHTYPADLQEGRARISALLARPHVVCVDMGHTHYNELANDGGTVFMATRSTGQIEEGPSGFSIAAVDGRGVSWRFKTLDAAWPFVLVTHPVDRRLVPDTERGRVGTVVRAKVFSDTPVVAVEMRPDDGEWRAMHPVEGQVALWQGDLPVRCRGITVRATGANGATDEDRVEPADPALPPPVRRADGSDADRIDAWPEKGVLGTQLGPNRNGRPW